MIYKPLFPYFGGKSIIAPTVWQAFGDVRNYVEPFFGSGAVFFCRPERHKGTKATVNDADGMVANFWRAVQSAPEAVAEYADWPVNENDLHARHKWLRGQCESLAAALEDDPEYFDAKIAGWWVWGLCCWIGGEWCSVPRRQLPHLGDGGQGIPRQRPLLIKGGAGVHRQSCVDKWAIADQIQPFAAKLRGLRVCSGDWSRICTPAVTVNHGLTGVFLDPPYSLAANRDARIYAVDSLSVADDAAKWAASVADDPLVRIVLCGYDSEHRWLLERGWREHKWSAHNGYGKQGHREILYLSPHCLQPVKQIGLFDNNETTEKVFTWE